MTAEESPKDDDFPVGMRVLAVDDDPTCLKLLEGLLQLCRYHVTTVSQGITALKLLRENKNSFDIVLSDVHMPDMDGFKLLELVGLEMDLPVIMMSVNSETSTVMKGITHGACDYLLKPIPIEKIRNIWQHVVRRKKVSVKDCKQNGYRNNHGKLSHGTDEGIQGCNVPGQADNNCKISKKRSDRSDEDDEDEDEENGNESEEHMTQKKPRVVWSKEMHQKFVNAVNHLGVDKAYPKSILEIMNVEKLTRENVASHLQKYRLYLKRISNVACQQQNMIPALGVRNSSFVPVPSMYAFGDFHSPGVTGQLPKTGLASFQVGARALGSLNSNGGLAINAPTSSGMIQWNLMHSLNDLGKTSHNPLSGSHHGDLFQEHDLLKNKQALPGFGGSSIMIDDTLFFSASQCQQTNASSFTGNWVANGTLNSSFLNVPDDPLMLQLIQQQHQLQGGQYRGLDGQLAVNLEDFKVNSGASSHMSDLDECNETWQNAVQLTGCSTTLPAAHPLSSDDFSTTGSRNSILLKHSSMNPSPLDLSTSNPLRTTSHYSAIGSKSIFPQATASNVNMRHLSVGNHDTSKFLLRSTGSSISQDMNPAVKKNCDIQKPISANTTNIPLCSSVYPTFQSQNLIDHIDQYPGQSNGTLDGKVDLNMRGRGAFSVKQYETAQTTDGIVKLEDHLTRNTKFEDMFESDDCNFLDDVGASLDNYGNYASIVRRNIDVIEYQQNTGDIQLEDFPMNILNEKVFSSILQ